MGPTEINLLLADDSVRAPHGFYSSLRKVEQFKVVAEVTNSFEVIAQLSLKAIDLILINARSAVADYKFISKIVCEYPAVKIVLFSSSNFPDRTQRFRALGVHVFVWLQVDIREVEIALREVWINGSHFSNESTSSLQGGTARQAGSHKKLPLANDLNTRDREVLKLWLQGRTSACIANELCLSPRTVEGRRRIIMQKTGARNLPELFRFALRNDLLEE